LLSPRVINNAGTDLTGSTLLTINRCRGCMIGSIDCPPGGGATQLPYGPYRHFAAVDSGVCALATSQAVLCWGFTDAYFTPPPTYTFSLLTATVVNSSQNVAVFCGLRAEVPVVLCWFASLVPGIPTASITVPVDIVQMSVSPFRTNQMHPVTWYGLTATGVIWRSIACAPPEQLWPLSSDRYRHVTQGLALRSDGMVLSLNAFSSAQNADRTTAPSATLFSYAVTRVASLDEKYALAIRANDSMIVTSLPPPIETPSGDPLFYRLAPSDLYVNALSGDDNTCTGAPGTPCRTVAHSLTLVASGPVTIWLAASGDQVHQLCNVLVNISSVTLASDCDSDNCRSKVSCGQCDSCVILHKNADCCHYVNSIYLTAASAQSRITRRSS